MMLEISRLYDSLKGWWRNRGMETSNQSAKLVGYGGKSDLTLSLKVWNHQCQSVLSHLDDLLKSGYQSGSVGLVFKAFTVQLVHPTPKIRVLAFQSINHKYHLLVQVEWHSRRESGSRWGWCMSNSYIYIYAVVNKRVRKPIDSKAPKTQMI